MGKQGPCCHCGVTSTPLWRNGPPEKPVLCNACGSRWRTKGTLVNYVPLHARLDLDDHEDYRVTRVKTISLKRRDEKLNKRKLNYDDAEDGVHTPDYSQTRTFRKNLVEDTSNRSSSGSAISNSESCAQFGSADASDLTGPAQSVVWDALVPSRKRSCVLRPKQSSVEKLTKDLHTILQEQASHFSDPSEEDLLFESGTPIGSVEFGHGSVLIRHPNSIAREEESEASSLSVDNKFCRAEESYATPASLLLLNNSKSFGVAKVKKLNCQIMHREQAKRDKSNNEKPNYWNHNSPLHKIDLTEIVNADVFWGHLSPDEQQFLLDYLPSVDTSLISDSIERMFANPNFAENLSSFKQLLAEGVFDSSFPGGKTEECEDLKRLVLSNFTKSKWVEHYTTIKDKTAKESTGECVNLSVDKSSSSGNMITVKKFQDCRNRVFPETKSTLKTPERVLVKSGNGNKGSCFIPTAQNPFAFHTSRNSFMLDSFQGENENSDDQDVLLDIPSNGSFAQAELLHPISRFPSQQASATSSSSAHPTFICP